MTEQELRDMPDDSWFDMLVCGTGVYTTDANGIKQHTPVGSILLNELTIGDKDEA